MLIDVDHALDYYSLFVKKDDRRVFVLLHAWEYSVLGMAFVLGVWHNPILLAAVLGHFGHVVGDQVANRPAHPLAYSIAYRTVLGFNCRHLFGEPPASFSDVMHHSIPLWRLIEPRLRRVAARLRGDR